MTKAHTTADLAGVAVHLLGEQIHRRLIDAVITRRNRENRSDNAAT